MRGWRPWTVQPPPGTPIDWDSPYAEGLSVCWTPQYTILSPGGTNGTFSSYGVNSSGVGAVFNGTSDSVSFNGTTGAYPAGLTFLYIASYLSAPSTSLQAVISRGAGSVANGFESSLYNEYGSPPNAVYSSYDPGSNTNMPLGFVNGREYSINGAPATAIGQPYTVSGAMGPLGSCTSNIALGAIFGGTKYYGNVEIQLALLWDSEKGAPHLQRTTSNPWQIFHRRRRTYSIPASTGATGSAAITEGADVVSASGAIAISGSAAITEGADTVSATGALAISGIAAIAEGADTVAASGTAGEVATAAITEGADSVAASGSLSVTGTASISEGADAVSATGAVSVTGTAAIPEGSDSVAATGSAVSGAVATITEQADAVSATGALSVSGSASIFEGGDIVVGQGALPPQVTAGSPYWTISRSYMRTFTAARRVPRSFTLARSYTRTFTVNHMSVRFPIKGTSEKVPLTFDFTQDLPSGVTLSGTPTLTVQTEAGTDSAPNAILNGAAGFNSANTQVIQGVQAGVNGVDYSITCTCPTTQSNLTLSLVGLLSVRRDLN